MIMENTKAVSESAATAIALTVVKDDLYFNTCWRGDPAIAVAAITN